MVSSKVAEASSKMLQAFSLLLTPGDKCSYSTDQRSLQVNEKFF